MGQDVFFLDKLFSFFVAKRGPTTAVGYPRTVLQLRAYQLGAHRALCEKLAVFHHCWLDACHGSQGPEFCTPQPLLVH